MWVVSIIVSVIALALAVTFSLLTKQILLLKKNYIKQSFAMTIAMGEYHMWIKDHLETYLIQQVLGNKEFLDFAKSNGLSIIKFEKILETTMKDSANYIKIQSDICLRKVSEPLAKDIDSILEKQ